MGSFNGLYRDLGVSLKGSIGILGFRGSYKWSCKSPNIGYNYSYPTYNPTYNYPWFSKCSLGFRV